MTAAWKASVQSRLTEMGRSTHWLEGQIGAGRGQVSRMLAGAQQTSKLVLQVCDTLHIPPPTIISNDRDEQELVRRFRSMDEEGKRAMLAILGRLTPDEDENS